MTGVTRRGFLGSILALGAAPAIVRANSLMRIVPKDVGVLTFEGVTGSDGALMQFSSSDLALSIDEFSRRYIQPAVEALAARVEGDLMRGITGRTWAADLGHNIVIRMPNAYTRRPA